MDQVEEVKGKVDIVELIQEYLPLKKAGRNFKGLCPFHGEKTPSFMVNPELQIFKCFGCGVGGDVFVFLEKIEGMEFGEALQHLAKRVGIQLVSYKPTQGEQEKERLMQLNEWAAQAYHFALVQHQTGRVALEYLTGRGVSIESIEKFRLGFAPEGWDFAIRFLVQKKKYRIEELERAGLVVRKSGVVGVTGNLRDFYDRFRNRIMFPLSNHRGQIVGFAGRVMPGADEKSGGKYVNTPETEIYHKSSLLFGLNITRSEIKTQGCAVVVEGEIDAIASYQAEVKNVVAIKGSALTEKQVELLHRLAETIVLALDGDLAGDAAARRGIEIADNAGMIIKVVNAGSVEVNPKKYKDPGEWAMADAEGWKIAVEKAIPIYDFYIQSAVERYGLEAIGKKKIGQELLPIWAKISDEIMKAHYIQKLGEILGVGEEVVREQMGKSGVIVEVKKVGGEQKVAERKQDRREGIEKDLMRLALQGRKVKELTSFPLKDWIGGVFWRRVIEELERGVEINQLSGELRPKVQELLLTEWVFEEKEWERALGELEKEHLKEVRSKLNPEKELEKIRDIDKRILELTKWG